MHPGAAPGGSDACAVSTHRSCGRRGGLAAQLGWRRLTGGSELGAAPGAVWQGLPGCSARVVGTVSDGLLVLSWQWFELGAPFPCSGAGPSALHRGFPGMDVPSTSPSCRSGAQPLQCPAHHCLHQACQ